MIARILTIVLSALLIFGGVAQHHAQAASAPAPIELTAAPDLGDAVVPTPVAAPAQAPSVSIAAAPAPSPSSGRAHATTIFRPPI